VPRLLLSTLWERAATSKQWHLRNLAACATGAGQQHQLALPLSETIRAWLHYGTRKPSRQSSPSPSLHHETLVAWPAPSRHSHLQRQRHRHRHLPSPSAHRLYLWLHRKRSTRCSAPSGGYRGRRKVTSGKEIRGHQHHRPLPSEKRMLRTLSIRKYWTRSPILHRCIPMTRKRSSTHPSRLSSANLHRRR
jgi:hypothetical protein